jgi:trans-aconitate 2-methyltransferase
VSRWSPEQYLKFGSERARPCHDLAGRVSVSKPRRVVDLGCGPGNSTAVLASRWPEVEIIGVDSSSEMIDVARASQPAGRWVQQDITEWAATNVTVDGQFDVVFSNAAIQWVPDHDVLLPRLLERVRPGGALAIQMPSDFNAPQHRLMRDIAGSAAWRSHFAPEGVREWHVHDLAFYYDVLAPRSRSVDFWQTTYLHVMANAEAIVEWYKGSALRPFLHALKDATHNERFTAEYLEGVRKSYPPQPDGRLLLPFPRIFLVAYR